MKVYAGHTNDDRFWALAVYAAEQTPARGKPVVIDIRVDLHELSPMSFSRTLPSGRPL